MPIHFHYDKHKLNVWPRDELVEAIELLQEENKELIIKCEGLEKALEYERKRKDKEPYD